MHQGTEKTWSNKSHDTYMQIEESLNASWSAATAAQDPYLKSGREQPWELGADPEEAFLAAVSPEMKTKFAAVKTEAELANLLDTLSFVEKSKLGLPVLGAVEMTAEELKVFVSGA